MNDFHDAFETRDPAEREAAQFALLRTQLAEARQHAPALAEALAGIDIAGIASRAELARVPVTRLVHIPLVKI